MIIRETRRRERARFDEMTRLALAEDDLDENDRQHAEIKDMHTTIIRMLWALLAFAATTTVGFISNLVLRLIVS